MNQVKSTFIKLKIAQIELMQEMDRKKVLQKQLKQANRKINKLTTNKEGLK